MTKSESESVVDTFSVTLTLVSLVFKDDRLSTMLPGLASFNENSPSTIFLLLKSLTKVSLFAIPLGMLFSTTNSLLTITPVEERSMMWEWLIDAMSLSFSNKICDFEPCLLFVNKLAILPIPIAGNWGKEIVKRVEYCGV